MIKSLSEILLENRTLKLLTTDYLLITEGKYVFNWKVGGHHFNEIGVN